MRIRRLIFAASLYLGLAGCQLSDLPDTAGIATPSYAQPAQGNLLDTLHQRGRQLLQVYQPTLFHNPDVKIRGYDTIAYTTLNGCGSPQIADNMVDVLRPDLIAKSGDKAAYAFVLPPLTRYIFQYGQCLSPAQLQRARGLLAQKQELFSHGTLNHALMSSTSYYLLAEHFPDQRWMDAQGNPHTSGEVISRYKGLLLSRFRKFMADGFNEQLSPTYSIANLYPLINLIDFAQDPDIRAAAEQMAVSQIALMRVDSLDGALMPPVERENPPPQITTNPTTNARDVLWFYYGGFGPINGRRNEAPYAAMLAASPWRPPSQLLALKSPYDVPYDVQINTPGFSIWGAPTQPELEGGAWIDKDFAIGAGNGFQDPAGYNDHAVTFRILIRGLQPAGAIECYQPYWEGDKGEDAWDTDRSSPFQRSWRSGRRGVLLYNIPASDPYHYPPSNPFFAERAKTASHLHQLAECRLPKAANELDLTPQGLFARYGPVFVALRSLGNVPVELNRTPSTPNLAGFITVKMRSPHAAIYYRIEPAQQGERLVDFEQQVASDRVGYDASSGTVNVPDSTGHRHTISFNAGSTPNPAMQGLVANSPLFRWAQGGISFTRPAQ